MFLKIRFYPFNPPFPCSIVFNLFLFGSGLSGLGNLQKEQQKGNCYHSS